MEPMEQTPDRRATNRTRGESDVTSNVENGSTASEAPQMKVMGRADGSRTTAGTQDPNTNLASRPDQSMGPMGNAAGLPPSHAPEGEKSANSSMMNDVADLVRQYPLPSMLIGMGIGYLFSRRSSWQR